MLNEKCANTATHDEYILSRHKHDTVSHIDIDSSRDLQPVVWSVDGPVLLVAVGPLCTVQSYVSSVDWVQPQVSIEKSQSIVGGPAEVSINQR